MNEAGGGAGDTSAPPSQRAEAARGICLNMLAVRARTRAELVARLQAKGLPDEICDPVLDRLAAAGLIDDSSYASAFVAARRRDRGLAGPELVRQLDAKGVDRAVALAAVSHLDATAERETARRLVERKLATMGHLDDAARARRLVGLLARKGYPASTCYSVLREVLGQQLDATDED